MKILVVMYKLGSVGGLINNTENLLHGFLEIGHDVDFVQLVWKESTSGKRTSLIDQYTDGALYPFHQQYGWLWPDGKRIPYKGKENIKRWKEYANKFDLVFWQVPAPTKKKTNKGNMDWVELYNLDVTQVTFIHDSHFKKYYPHLWFVKDKLTGAGCVNLSSYSHFELAIPKCAIFSPQYIPDDYEILRYSSRNKGWLSCQTFKAWKRVGELVRAVPYMDDDIEKILAGKGIEYYYMTSDNKVKDKYLTETGEYIWDVAIDHGMKWLDWIHPHERDEILKKVRTLIDPSWNHRFAEYGGHFNRVVVEAIIQGVIPLARNLGMSGTEDGNGEIFKAGENYIMIPWDATPQEFAEIVNYANNLSEQEACDIQDAGWEIIDHWDRKHVAQQFIDLSEGKGTGYYGKLEVVATPEEVIEKAHDVVENYFGEAED